MPDDFKVSETMETYFANFIKTGNPNGDGLPHWPNLHATQPEFMLIDVNSVVQPFKNLNRYKLPVNFFTR
jgi:para-nitrobenzyl esterase